MSDDRRAAVRFSPLVLVAALGTVVFITYALARVFAAPIGWDQAWLLYAAQHMLSGVELYGPHLTETNPPGMIWASIPPALLSHLFHLQPALTLRLLTLFLIAASTAWCLRLSRLDRRRANPVFLVLLGCVLLLVAFQIDVADFGQREHLFVFLALPYIMASASADRLSISERLLLGVAAGIGSCLKPQEMIVLFAVEGYLILKTRSLRRLVSPEFLALICTGALYVLLIRFLTPLYLRNIFPLLLDTYWAFGEGTAFVLATRVKRYLVEFVLACLAYHLLSNRVTPPKAVSPLLVASAAAFVAYCIQHTHWLYHRYPLQAFLELACAFLLLPPATDLLTNLSRHPRLEWIVAVLALIPVAVSLPKVTRQLQARHAHPAPDELGRFFSQYPSGQTVDIFTTSLTPFPAVFDQGLTWGSRFVHLWMLPAIVKNESGPHPSYEPFKQLTPARLEELSSLQRTQSAEDLNYWRPSVVLVERCTVASDCQGIHNRNFDILNWFLQSPQFRDAWSHYQRQPDTLSKYDIYTRAK